MAGNDILFSKVKQKVQDLQSSFDQARDMRTPTGMYRIVSQVLSESMHEIKRHFLGPDNLSQSERIRKVATSLRRGSIESAGTTSVESCISSEVKDALHNGNSNTSDDNDVESPPIMMHFMASAVSILDSIDSLGEIESFGEGDDDQSQSSCGWQQRVDIELGNSFASIASSSYTC